MSQISTTSSAYAEDGFRIGGTISRSFAVLSRHFVAFGIMSAISVAPLSFLDVTGPMPFGKTLDPGQVVALLLLFLVGLGLWILLQMIAQSVIFYGTFQDMRGKPGRIGEAITKGLARFLPILGLFICNTVAVMACLVLFVVPGIMLAVATYVALPVCLLERLGPIASMKRSVALTQGHRWKIFGVLIIVVTLSAGGEKVTSTILTVVGGPPVENLWPLPVGRCRGSVRFRRARRHVSRPARRP